MKKQHVVVVGGGLIGLSVTHALLREGHAVTVVERHTLGSGASTGNAGELTPQQVAPLASSNTARDIVRGVFTGSSYLSIAPLQLPKLIRFGVGFLLASKKCRVNRGAAALAQFADGILPALWRMRDDGIDVSGGGEGYLMTCSNEVDLVAAHANYADRGLRKWGEEPGPILRGAALANQEPTLQGTVTGGFMLPGEFSLDPVTFVGSLAEHIAQAGATIRTGLTAHRIGEGASVVCIDQSGKEIVVAGDRIVVAAGAWTTQILKRSGIRSTGIVAGKGYSYTVPVREMPRTLVHALDLHCVAIPMHNRLRIVGMMEFDGHPERLNRARIDVLTQAASRLIGGAEWGDRTDEWVGARPMTADGMPLLGEVGGRPEVIIASGHNMHGLSLGPATGEVVADLVAKRPVIVAGRPLNLAPFAVHR